MGGRVLERAFVSVGDVSAVVLDFPFSRDSAIVGIVCAGYAGGE